MIQNQQLSQRDRPRLFLWNCVTSTAPLVVHANGRLQSLPCFSDLAALTPVIEPISSGLGIVVLNSGPPGPMEQQLGRIGLSYVNSARGIRQWRNSRKITLILQALRTSTYDVLLCLDALDTCLIDHPNAVLEGFRQFFGGKGIVFNGEINCWPEGIPPEHLALIRQHEAAPRTTIFSRLNSGVWIGERSAALRCYELAERYLRDPKFRAVAHSDQAMLRRAQVDLYPEVRVDDGCRLFQSLFATTSEMIELRSEESEPRHPLLFPTCATLP